MLTYATILCRPAPTATPGFKNRFIPNKPKCWIHKIYRWANSYQEPVHYSPKTRLDGPSSNKFFYADIPVSTVWKLLSKTDKASRRERLETALMTSCSLVNSLAIWLSNTKHTKKKSTPTHSEVKKMTLTENFAALASPLPSSFETLTLNSRQRNQS